MRARRPAVLAALALIGCLLASCGFQEPPLDPTTREVLNRVEIPPISRLTATTDAMVVDPATQTLYVADSTDPTHQGVDVFDIHSVPGRYVKIISTGDTLPNGLVIAPDVHRMYTGDDDGTVKVIDLDPTSPHYQTIIGSLNMNGTLGADLVAYDQPDHRVFVNNPDDAFLTAIDSRTDRIVGRITNVYLGDAPVYDPADGMLYIGTIDDNQIVKMDPRTLKVVQRYSFDVPCEPHGMAINPTTNQGLIGCADRDTPVTISWDFTRGAPIKYFDLSGAGDLLIYDSTYNEFIFAASNYSPAEMSVFSGSPIAYLTSVPTAHKAHDVAYDDVHRAIYTTDGRLREAALWEFPDPLLHCDKALTHCSSEANVPPPIKNGAPAGGREAGQ
jgi:DNA-binding beta-propeller fold protein YncE